jgi:hypothetical protein
LQWQASTLEERRVQPIDFAAPWSRDLKRRTLTVVSLFVALSIVAFFQSLSKPLCIVLAIAPISAIGMALLYGIRGYRVTEKRIEILRFGWTRRLPIDGLVAVEGKAEAMQKAYSIFAKGIFAKVGFYWSKELGFVFAYATDLSRSVLLTYRRRRYVVTPHDPQQFIMRVRTLVKTAEYRD